MDEGNQKRLFGKIVVNSEGCWGWVGAVDADGYPIIWSEGRMRRAQRVVWELRSGTIHDDLMVLHSPQCKSRRCLKPEHLYLGDRRDNELDKRATGTVPATHIILSEEQLQMLRALRQSGATLRQLAEWTGLSRTTVMSATAGYASSSVTRSSLQPEELAELVNAVGGISKAAELVGVTTRSVSRWLSGVRSPSEAAIALMKAAMKTEK